MEHCGMQTYYADVDELVRLVRENKFSIVVEVGTWVGATACRLADAGCTVTCIDWFRGCDDPNDIIAHNRDYDTMYGQFKRNCGDRLWRTVFPVVAETTGADWIQGPFDMAFIDADHRYEHCKADIERWERCVKPGGIVACHDHEDKFPGVVRAIKERRGDAYTVSGFSLAWWRV